jgi:hypothetical protein
MDIIKQNCTQVNQQQQTKPHRQLVQQPLTQTKFPMGQNQGKSATV